MKSSTWVHYLGKFGLAISLAVSGVIVTALENRVWAQIVPDATLGVENSLINPGNINGIPTKLIEGGASRGAALFHSFLQFNVGEGQRVYFANPVGIESIFSRVTGNEASNILGTLGVNGGASLFLINPNGIVFGENARLDIRGSFVASTADGLVFDNGLVFSAKNPDVVPLLTVNLTPGLQYGASQPAAVVNGGNLGVGEGESLTLMGGTVVNGGELSAPGGKISLAAVPGNSLVQLTPLTWQELPTTGDVALGNGALSVAELVDGAGLGSTGIPVDVNPGSVAVSGVVDVSNGEGIGGIVQFLGDRVGLFDAGINASGRDGGGTVLIGGDYRGEGLVPNASRTYVSSNSVINADALVNGDGGKVIVWADETADIYGYLTARGGSVSGNGGLIETSGKQFLNLNSTPDASALNGNGGTWLIDPTNITIANSGGAIGTNMVNVANINAVLNTGTNVTIATNIGGSEQGNITQNSDAPISKISGGNAVLTFQAENNIILNGDITSSSGKLDINLLADSDNSGEGSLNITNSAINTNGGNFRGFGRGSANFQRGIFIVLSSLNTESGNIDLVGTGRNGGNNFNNGGIDIQGGELRTTGTGNIILTGTGGNGIKGNFGVQIQSNSVLESTGTGNIYLEGVGGNGSDGNRAILIGIGSRVSAVDGNISLTGQGASGPGSEQYGIDLGDTGVIEATGKGNISLTGISTNGSDNSLGILIRGIDTRISSVDGNISLMGQGASGFGGTHRGIQLFNAGVIEATGKGNITLTGIGGNNLDNSAGVLISGIGSRISSADGNISLTGAANGIGSNNTGIFVELGGAIESRGTGSITLEGTSSAGFSDNQGIQINGVGSIVSSVEGNITVLGTAGASNGDRNHGFYVGNGGLVQSTGSGSIDITGISEAKTNNIFGNEGIAVERGGVESTGTGNITLVGTGGTGGDGSDGDQGIVVINPNARVTSVDGDIFMRGISRGTGTNHYGIWIAGFFGEATVRTTGAGNIFLEGIVSGTGNNSDGIVFSGTEGTVVEATGVGNISLTANEITIASPSLNKFQGNSLLRLQPLDPTLGITIGGTVADTRLNLDSSEINSLQNGFSQIIIGQDNSSGEITVLPTTFTSPTKIQSPVAGGTITTTGAINTNNNPLTLIADSTVTLNNDITTGRGNLEVVGNSITQTAKLSENGDTSFTSTNGNITLNDITAERLTVTSTGAILANGILNINGDANFTNSSGNITLNNITADNLNVTSPGTILGNGILTIKGDATFTTTLANAGNVTVTNTKPTTIGYSIIGGNFLLNSAFPISHALGEPLQVAGNLSVNGGSSNPLINSIGLPSSPIQQNGDLIISQVGTINLPANTIAGNLIVNSLPEAVLAFNAVLDNPAITLNQANSFGGILRFQTSKDAISATGIPGITQNGTQIVGGTATFKADTGNINLTDSANQFGNLTFTGNDVSISENNATNLLTSTATGNLNLNSGGIITQIGGLTVGGDANFTTTFPNAGNVILTNQNATILGNSLIGGNFIIDSGGRISQLLGQPLQVAGNTTILNPAGNPNLDTSGTIIPRLNLPNGDVIITEVGTINLIGETFSGNLTVNSLSSALQFIPGIVYDSPAIILNQQRNNFGGAMRFTTDAPTTIVEIGTPGIIQSGSLDVSGTATFKAENGNITLNNSGNQFGNLSFIGNNISIQENNATNLLTSTATGNLNLITNGAITQSGSLKITGTSNFTSLQPNAQITLTNANQLTGDIHFNTLGNGSVTLLNTLANTQLASSNVPGNFTITSGGRITQTQPLNLAGVTTLNAGNSDITLNQNNDFNILGINGGRNVRINDINDINLSNSSVSGNLNVTAIGNITSQDIFNPSASITLTSSQGSIDTTGGTLSTFSFGSGGAINLSAEGDIILGNLDSSAGYIAGGDITITSNGSIFASNIFIFSKTFGLEKSGDITIEADSVSFSNGARLFASTSGVGNGGNITVNGSDFVELINGSGLSTNTNAFGDAGNVTINTRQFTVKNNQPGSTQQTGVFTGTFIGSSGEGGNLTINASESVQLIGNEPGKFTPNPLETGKIIDVADTPTGLTAATFGTGNAGKLTINTGQLIIRDGAGITASSLASGNGGELRVNATSVELQGKAGLATATLSSGDSGNLIIDADKITLIDGAIISTDTTITASGNANNIEITTNQLNIFNGSRIGAATFNQGSSGDIIIKAAHSINVIGTSANGEVPSGIFTETRGAGDAGDITIQTPHLQVQDGAKISAATSGGKGGTIQVTTNTLTATDRGQFSTTTAGNNDAGDIIFNVKDSINLTGKGSGLFANTLRGSTGNGGSIFIDPISVNIQDGATVAVNSQGSGEGGDIEIQAGSLFMNNSATITSETTSNQGGNITLKIDDLLLMRHGSKISTTAGTDLAGGNGGNITINAPFIVGIPEEDSDITANAYQGNGGRINITAQSIVGLEFRDRLTPLSDITASSELGLDGVVAINTPGIDPSRGLNELAEPQNPRQIEAGCPAYENKFTVTGSGGLPQQPDEALRTEANIPPRGTNSATIENFSTPVTSKSTRIVEAKGWVINERGEVVLVADVPNITSYNPWWNTPQCHEY